jgi:hypothetical protein
MLTIALALSAATTPIDDRAAIEAVSADYVDGQYEGDPTKVARSLHPDLAKRAVLEQATTRELAPLRRMSADELIDTARQGLLKTPPNDRKRQIKVLDVAGNIAVVRVDTPWFVDFLELGRTGGRWLIVNALWWNKPQPTQPKD